MKSGTSYLQAVMMTNRALLAERGLMLPGKRWRDQVSGVADVLSRARVAVQPREGAWQALVDEVDAWDGTGLISMEFLGPIGLKRIGQVVSSFPEGTVEVVVTARDLNRNIPAMWQESLKNGQFFGLEEYVAAIRANEGPGKAFWREQTIGAMCRRWSEVVGVDRVSLVTVPHPGASRDELWARFSHAVGVDGVGVTQPAAGNESLGAASVEVLRRLNERLTDLSFQEYAPVVKHGLAKKVLARRRVEEPPVGFPVPTWLPELSSRMILRLKELGVRVVGDLAELEPVAVPGVETGEVVSEPHLDAALDALEASVRRLVAANAAENAPTNDAATAPANDAATAAPNDAHAGSQ
jgi:hypothetical protein